MFAALNAFQTGGPTLPVNIVAPAVTGTATVRQTLSVSTGTWVGAPTITYAYQWQRNTVNISGATSSTYTLVDADATAVIRCVVTATNLFGSASANSNNTGAVATTVPSAPTIGTATRGNAQATVTFTAPTSTGGTAITSYTAVSSPGGLTATGASSPLTVTGLSNGTAYTFTVYATNAVGNSAPSASSNSVTPATVPGAPTIGTATATGTTTATVSYTAPASNGGSTITSYTAVSSPGGITGTLATSGSGTISISGLSSGTSYTFTVYATNALGNSASSASSNQITTQAIAGQAEYTGMGSYTFVVPSGVTSVSMLAVGPGGLGGAVDYGETANGGGGGGLAYINNFAVTPGESLTVYVASASGGASYIRRGGSDIITAYGGDSSGGTAGGFGTGVSGTVGYSGGSGGIGGSLGGECAGGGGAAGYSGNGGSGGSGKFGFAGSSGSGGGGGGGGGRLAGGNGGGGGGVGILGQGSSGSGGGSGGGGGDGGSGGSAGGAGTLSAFSGGGGSYGGGGGGGDISKYFGFGATGAVRILWPGTSRSYPSTNTGNL